MTAESKRLNWLPPGRCDGALRYSLTRRHALTSHNDGGLISVKRGLRPIAPGKTMAPAGGLIASARLQPTRSTFNSCQSSRHGRSRTAQPSRAVLPRFDWRVCTAQ